MSSNARWRSALLAVAVSVAVGACSADVTRFDFPAFDLSESNGPTGALAGAPGQAQRPGQGFDVPPGAPPRGVGAANEPMAPVYGAARPGSYQAERVASARDARPQNTPLPPLVPEHRAPPAGQPAYAAERGQQASAPDYLPERSQTAQRDQAPANPRAGLAADTIQVEAGDTLYSLSKRYGVSLADLIEANRLHHGTSLKPGQQIVLPAGALARQARREARAKPAIAMVPVAKAPVAPAVLAANPAADPSAAATAAVPSGWEGRYTIKTGESLYGIARQHRVTLAELQRVNGITNPLRVKVGTTVMVPGNAPAAPAPEPAARRDLALDAPATPRIINTPAERKVVAARSDQVSDADPVSPAAMPAITAAEPSSGRFRWPARGRVIAAYGRRPDGTHNDGINLALPQGAEIHATEGGKVAYAGNELKGYGNLVLIRHDNGWVSAYAHNEELLVKRDDVVRRGQVIAKAGKTGTVDQPQLHFELRQGSKPVDPLPHLEKN
jgi:murein DD-endopeptidase MepM/ murein hydrolase activator NlpD